MIYISSDDLQFHFGVDHPEKVDPASYQVIRIVNPLKPVRHHPRGHLLGKRSGEDTGDLTHNLQVKAFGKKYEVCNILSTSFKKHVCTLVSETILNFSCSRNARDQYTMSERA